MPGPVPVPVPVPVCCEQGKLDAGNRAPFGSPSEGRHGPYLRGVPSAPQAEGWYQLSDAGAHGVGEGWAWRLGGIACRAGESGTFVVRLYPDVGTPDAAMMACCWSVRCSRSSQSRTARFFCGCPDGCFGQCWLIGSRVSSLLSGACVVC